MIAIGISIIFGGNEGIGPGAPTGELRLSEIPNVDYVPTGDEVPIE